MFILLNKVVILDYNHYAIKLCPKNIVKGFKLAVVQVNSRKRKKVKSFPKSSGLRKPFLFFFFSF